MREDQLRLGVVRLILVNGNEMSVRASDIVACLAIPARDERALMQEAQLIAERHRAQVDMQARGLMVDAGGAIHTIPVYATSTATASVLGTQTVGRPPDHTRRTVILRGVPQVYEVKNSRDEIEGWMRDE